MKRDHVHSLLAGIAQRAARRDAVNERIRRSQLELVERKRRNQPGPKEICDVIEKLIAETPDALKAGEDILRRLRRAE